MVEHRTWTEEEISQLGTCPDSVLAEELGRGLEAVRAARKLRKIAGFSVKGGSTFAHGEARRPGALGDIEGTFWSNVSLDYQNGQITLAELGNRYGVNPATIWKKAHRLGWKRPAKAK